MFAPNEVASLIMGLSAASLIVFVFWKELTPKFTLFFVAFFCILCANFSTLIEGVLWYPFFNSLEHLSFAVAGVVFALAGLSLRKRRE